MRMPVSILALFAAKPQILFVCAANICRSPLAEGVMRHRLKERGVVKKYKVVSAGTQASQPGHKPDSRAVRVAASSGVSMAGIKARQVKIGDIVSSDIVVALDRANLRALHSLFPEEHHHKIHLLMSFASELDLDEVPDPYYGNYGGFENVYNLIDIGVSGLIDTIIVREGNSTAC